MGTADDRATQLSEHTCSRINAPRDRFASPVNRFLVLQVAVVILFGPYLANLYAPFTAYILGWECRDACLVLAAMLLLALVWFAVGEALRRVHRPVLTRLFDHVFLVVLGAGLITNLWFHSKHGEDQHYIAQHGVIVQTAWLALLGVTVYSFSRPASQIVHRCRQFCLIVSPASLILALQLLAQNRYPAPVDPLPTPRTSDVITASHPSDSDPPVYMFIFDAWSYRRTFREGAVRDRFPHLRDLAECSMVFHDAHSPGSNTHPSIPRLLFQNKLETMVARGRVGFERDGTFLPADLLPTLFEAVPAERYHTAMIGFYTPYKVWLGDRVDTCRAYCWYEHGYNTAELLGMHIFNAMQHWTDPWSTQFYETMEYPLRSARVQRIHEDIKRDVLYFIEKGPRATFGLFHYPAPHWPYILKEDGSFRSLDEPARKGDDIEGYMANLVATDRLIGEFVDAMKRADRFDDALIIMTSDHGWRLDPERRGNQVHTPVTHVPLLIKLPHQERAVSVTTHFETRHLRAIITAGVQGVLQPDEIDDVLTPLVARADKTRSKDNPTDG